MPNFRTISKLWENLITGWALTGGMILLLVVAINISSIIGSVFLMPVPGDFELTQIGVAVAIFCFLPYCQLHRTNVTAEIFTFWAKNKTILVLQISASLITLSFSILLMWRMFEGLLDQKKFDYTTTILQFPIWVAFVPILISLCLLSIASMKTMMHDFSQDRKFKNAIQSQEND